MLQWGGALETAFHGAVRKKLWKWGKKLCKWRNIEDPKAARELKRLGDVETEF